MKNCSTGLEPRPKGRDEIWASAAIRDHAQAKASLQQARGWIDDGQKAIRSTTDVVEHARRFLVAWRIEPAADAGSVAAADTGAGLDFQMRAFGDSVDCLVARVHDAISEAARDYSTVNELRQAVRRLEAPQWKRPRGKVGNALPLKANSSNGLAPERNSLRSI
jgi:hypothetical protein